jgi:hypothetical protein
MLFKNTTTLFMLLLCLQLTACANTLLSSNKIIPYMSVGSGTPKGNDIWITEFVFDDNWTAPKGAGSCCWGKASGTQGIFNRPAPKRFKITWFDYLPERHFQAEVTLSDELYDYTLNLPNYFYVVQKEETDIEPILIVGLGKEGEVVVWISNAAGSRNISGRVMHEVGRAQATCIPSHNEGVPNNC